jgi:hypothetical protein
MPGIRTSAITYRRGISNSTPNFFLIAQANYVIPQPTSRFRQPVPTPAAPVTPVTPYAPTPDTTILEYLTDQVVASFVWGVVTFTRDTNLPGFCYTAITTTIPALVCPQAVASISSITIGNIVTSIGQSAFFGATNSSSLTFTPTSTLTSIGGGASNGAFQNCFSEPSISTSITIPNSVTSIGTNAFRNCDKLVSVTLPTNPSFITIGQSAFQACDVLASITIPNSVTSILTNAFFGCTHLASVTLSSTLTSIGNTAFKSCPLTSITIPNSVTSIGTNAFQLSGLTTVTISSATATALPPQSGDPPITSPTSNPPGVAFFGVTVATIL